MAKIEKAVRLMKVAKLDGSGNGAARQQVQKTVPSRMSS